MSEPVYGEVILRLVGLDPEPEGPAVIGVVVRLPIVDEDPTWGTVQRAAATADSLIPRWPGRVETYKVEVMLGGVWHAAEGDGWDDDDE